MFEFYKVGGTIRDRLLGLKSKDTKPMLTANTNTLPNDILH